jgi:sn-glycerol 3-phosphate transport system permease protein
VMALLKKETAGKTGLVKLRSKIGKEALVPYLLVAPAMLFLVLFTFYPAVQLAYLSFFDYNLINPIKEFVGFDNFYTLFFIKTDFLVTLANTAVFTGASVVLQLFFAVLLALWFQSDNKFNHFAQTAIFTPHLIAMISCAMIWSWVMDENSFGLLNVVLGFFKLPPLRWLNSTSTAMLSVIIVAVWKGVGYHTLIVMSGLKSIPVEIFEAAALDNAPKWRTFFKITFPMLSPQLFFLLITMTIGSFKVFDVIRIMTNGGPGNATDVVSYYIYRYAFLSFKIGYASAAGTVLMVILTIMTAIYFKLLAKKVHYQ